MKLLTRLFMCVALTIFLMMCQSKSPFRKSVQLESQDIILKIFNIFLRHWELSTCAEEAKEYWPG